MKINFNELKNYENEEVVLQGFVDKIRNLQYVQFVILRDSTGKVQITIEKNEENAKMVEIIDNLTQESTLKVKGKVLINEKVKMGGIEVIPSSITVTSLSLPELPLDIKSKDNSLRETRLDYRFLDLRREENNLFFKCETILEQAFREYCVDKGFIEIHSPKIAAGAAESGAEVFKIDYFGQTACLSQSPQFYKQMAMSSGFERIFEVAPCFRAENSNTNRHATEFTSFDVEFSYINSFEDVMNLEAEMITYGIKHTKEELGDKIKEVFGVDIVVPSLPFPKMTVAEIYKEIEERYGYKVDDSEKTDLTTEAEKLVGKLAHDKYNHEYMFVTEFPAEKRPFYHMRDENGILQGYDLIWKGMEITSGAEREHRYDKLLKSVQEKGLGEDVKFYLEFFKYGCPPHGGFAIGVDRLTMLILGIPTIKESEFLFRGPNRLNP